MEAVKFISKGFVLLIEYSFLLAFFFPYLFLLLFFYLIQWCIDECRYESDMTTVRNGTAKERRDVARERNKMDWKRNTTFAERMYDYWKEHLFSKKSRRKKSRR